MRPECPRAVKDQLVRLGVSRESWLRLEQYVNLLLTWQRATNLIAPSTIPEVWTRHVLDSLQLLPHVPQPLKMAADLGSGGGFPALPLAICTGAEFHLYEANQKKAAFLREALRLTDSKGHVHAKRLESLSRGAVPEGLQLITARAFAPLELLLAQAQPFLKPGVMALLHKGKGLDHELTQALKSWRIQFVKLKSLTDSEAVLLQIQEALRVNPKS
jgi:16S rRNA (guanine527-N7)-methyltransferase